MSPAPIANTKSSRRSTRWIAGLIAIACMGAIAHPVSAQSDAPESSVPAAAELSPLEILEPDPLLPEMPEDRELTPQEQNELSNALDELSREANAEYRRGNVETAVELWLRVARLRRYLGPKEEVRSLTELGEVAWQENRTLVVSATTRRLEQIEQEALLQSPLDYDLLLDVAEGYEAMRARPQAVATYQILLERAQQQQDLNEMKRILKAMGELQLAWFDYPGAAVTYEELRRVAQETDDRRSRLLALERLSTIYQESEEYESAIIVQNELLTFYDNRRDRDKIPLLKITIAENYAAIERPDLAATTYQEAFVQAQENEQLGLASDALRGLASLYLLLDRLDDARIVYELLVDIERQSYSQYGMMFAYDRIGQIYRVQGFNNQAIAAFQQGLQLARDLKYKEAYFQEQIQELQSATP